MSPFLKNETIQASLQSVRTCAVSNEVLYILASSGASWSAAAWRMKVGIISNLVALNDFRPMRSSWAPFQWTCMSGMSASGLGPLFERKLVYLNSWRLTQTGYWGYWVCWRCHSWCSHIFFFLGRDASGFLTLSLHKRPGLFGVILKVVASRTFMKSMWAFLIWSCTSCWRYFYPSLSLVVPGLPAYLWARCYRRMSLLMGIPSYVVSQKQWPGSSQRNWSNRFGYLDCLFIRRSFFFVV